MRTRFHGSGLLFVVLVPCLLAGGALLAKFSLASGGSDHRPDTGGLPALTAYFHDWAHCDGEGRVESHPGTFFLPKWGPAALLGGSGCGSCGGGGSFNGDPHTAGLGMALAPPHDQLGDPGQLPPGGRDHPFVLAGSGEVVYTETDFVIPGKGFDFHWTRTYRSAYEYGRDLGYGWDYSAQLFLVENSAGTAVNAYLGDGRVEDQYTWDSQSSSWTSPEGFNDQLTEATRSAQHPTYPSQNYFIKTEKNGLVWEFDLVFEGPNNDFYACTSIADPWGNDFLFEYGEDNLGQPLLTKVTDTEGREATFTRDANYQITQIAVSSSAVGDYGNIDIDYEYSGDRLTKVTKHSTRQTDGGSKVRPYTEYTYYTTGNRADDLDLVKDCGTTVLDFDYADAAEDRCTQVTDADGEVHAYYHDQTDASDDWTKYIDPMGQRRDFVYADLANDDRTIMETREWLEDEDGDDLTSSTNTTILRGCDCGQITKLSYADGSYEEWSYDSWGNLTEYERMSSNGQDPVLRKVWTYDSFANRSRRLTSSGWIRAETTPSAKITWAWDANDLLDSVTLPAVTTGQPESQTIVLDYSFNSNGTLNYVTNAVGEKSAWSYSGDTVTRTDDPDAGGLQRAWVTAKDLFGNVTSTTDPTNATWTTTVAPDGRVLKVAGPNSQETKYEYDLRGRRTKEDKLLVASSSTRVESTRSYSTGSKLTSTVADSAAGGIQATTTNTYATSSRYTQSIDPDDYGSKTLYGYGSHGLPWKVYNLDDTGQSTVETLVLTYERNTLGRVVAEVHRGGYRVEYVYDGYGRKINTKTPLPNGAQRETVLTLKDWGAVEKVEVKVGTTTYTRTTSYFDEAIRVWKVVEDDVVGSLSDRVTEYQRDAIGRVAKRKDPRGKTWETQWDAVGRTKKTIDPVGNEIQTSYDDTNRKTTVTSHEKDTSDASFTDYVSETIMDASGRVTSAKDKGSTSTYRTTTSEFDEGGRLVKVTRPEGNETTWVYDKLRRTTQETRQIDGSTTTATTTTTWSAGGRRTKVQDANNVETWWTFNSFGQELTVVYNAASTPTRTYTKTYDSSGRLYTETSPEGAVLTRTYDDGGRNNQIDIAKNSSGFIGPDRVVFVFDDLDRVTSGKTQDESGGSYTDLTSVSRSYDGFSELSSETQNGSFAFSYSYAANGALDEITYPSGGPVLGARYVFDDDGRVDSVDRKLNTTVEGIGSVVWDTGCATLEYEGWREIQRVQDAYDLDRTQTWTAYQEPAVLRYEKDSTNALLTGLDNDWDDNGRLVARARLHDTVGSDQYGELFQYDDMDRLKNMWTDLKDPGSYLSYSVPESTAVFDEQVFYDLGKVYERKDRKVNPDDGQDQWTAHAITNNNFYQYTAVDGQAQTYDDDGQLTDNGPWAFRWTALGQLAEADPDSGTTLENEYDAFGRRVTRTAGNQVNCYVYLGWHMIGEYDGTADEWLWQEIPMNRGEGMLEHLALDTNDLDDDQNTTEYRQYGVQTDFQETVWGLSDTSGGQVERYLYADPYGVSSTEDASGTGIGDYATEVYHRKRLHGGVVDAGTKLYDFRNRWMDPESAAWTSKDPLGFVDSLNRFQFAMAAPLVHADTSGLLCTPSGCTTYLPGSPEDGVQWEPFNDPECDCPCQKELQDLKDLVKEENTPEQYLGTKYGDFAYGWLRLQLLHTELKCEYYCPPPPGGWGNKCAEMKFAPFGSSTDTIVIYVRPFPGSEINPETGRPFCEKCCSVSCQEMVEHELFHATCTRLRVLAGVSMAQAKKDCAEARIPQPEVSRCGKAVFDWLRTPNSKTWSDMQGCWSQWIKP